MNIQRLRTNVVMNIARALCILALMGFGPAASAMVVERGFLPLSDGTQLNYVLTRPDGPGPFPVALTYGPYSEGYVTTSNLPQVDIATWMAEGYAHLSVNFRGTGCSGGTFQPFNSAQWGADGAEIVEWAAKQPWSNGRIGMYGLSFPGTSQLVTAAFSRSGHLKAIAPWASFPDFYRDLAYPGGVFNSFIPVWIVAGREFVGINQAGGPGVQPAPACEINPLQYLGPDATEALGVLAHPYIDDFYAKQPDSYVGLIRIPVYGCVAWQDTTIFSRSFEMYRNQLNPATTWLVGNNGAHDNCARAIGPTPPGGPTPLLKFFERYVKGIDNGWESTPHLVIPHEVDNNNKPGWTTSFATWADSAKQTTPVVLFLHADGLMDQTSPKGSEAPDSYNYPATTANTPADWAGQNAFNNPAVPGSSVTYTSPALTQDAEFFGTGSVNLWISSTATDADVQVMLSEIRPDGQEMFVENGWLRLSHRKLDAAKTTALLPVQTHLQADAEPLQSGQAVLGRIELLPFNHVFRAGSAIRLSIDAPGKWFVPLATPAVNSIFHTPDMVSQLVLGWIPGGKAHAPLPACGSLLNQPCRVSATPIPAGKLSIGTASTAGNQAQHGGGALDVMVLLGLLLAWLSRQMLRSRFIVVAKDSRGFPTRISASLYFMHKIATDQGHKQSRSQADRKAAPWFANNKIYEEQQMGFRRRSLKFVTIKAGIILGATLLVACSRSSAPQTSGSTDLGECTTDVATDQTIVPSLLPSVEQVRSRQIAADQFGNGFRISANPAEIAYIHHLAAQLRALGATEVTEEPYTFTSWSPKTTKLSVVQGPSPGPVKVAYFIPSSGSTGPNGLTAPVTYLSALSDVNLVSALYNALNQQSPDNALLAIQATLQNAVGGGVSLAQVIASANVTGKIVMYDAPRLSLPIGVFQALSVYVNNSSGTMGPLTPYSRPFVEELLTIGVINEALKAAGAAGAIAVLDYPPSAADNSYVPFGGLAIPSIPSIYLDRYTGAALKQQIVDAGLTPLTVKLTLDATESQATSYNVSGLIPGACKTQILVSSHTDGPNSIEDNGPAAILSIADYFARAPASQRHRGLKIVFTGGHMVGSPGINAYIEKHQADLTANALTAIEIEHLGAREWLELSPGTMALDGLPEPLVLYAGVGSVQQDENIKFAKNFDRSMVTIPLPFGEGPAWASAAGLPKIQVITGPVYLLNGPLPEVSSEYTDYDLEQRQITALIQMILNLNTQTAATLLADKNIPTVPLP